MEERRRLDLLAGRLQIRPEEYAALVDEADYSLPEQLLIHAHSDIGYRFASKE